MKLLHVIDRKNNQYDDYYLNVYNIKYINLERMPSNGLYHVNICFVDTNSYLGLMVDLNDIRTIKSLLNSVSLQE